MPKRGNIRRTTARHIIGKLLKIKVKEKSYFKQKKKKKWKQENKDASLMCQKGKKSKLRILYQ